MANPKNDKQITVSNLLTSMILNTFPYNNFLESFINIRETDVSLKVLL